MDNVRILPKDIDPGDIWEKMALLRERNTWRLFTLCVKSNEHAKIYKLQDFKKIFFFLFYAFSHTVCLDSDFLFEARRWIHNFFNFEDIWLEGCDIKEREWMWMERENGICMLSLYILWKGDCLCIVSRGNSRTIRANKHLIKEKSRPFFFSFFILFSFRSKCVHVCKKYVYIDFTLYLSILIWS